MCCYICFVEGWNLTKKGFQAFSLKFLQKYVKAKKLFDTFWGLTEGLPLGPKSESAPPRISSSSNSRAGEAKISLQCSVEKVKGPLNDNISRAHPLALIVTSPGTQRGRRVQLALWLAILERNPPTPRGTELWILGHQGLIPRAYPRYTPELVAEACQSVVLNIVFATSGSYIMQCRKGNPNKSVRCHHSMPLKITLSQILKAQIQRGRLMERTKQ